MSLKSRGSWTFLSNHAHALIYISRHPEARLRDVAEAVGITERFAHRVVSDLVDGGYLVATREGRRKTYAVNGKLPFRHPLEQGVEVVHLLDLFPPAQDSV